MLKTVLSFAAIMIGLALALPRLTSGSVESKPQAARPAQAAQASLASPPGKAIIRSDRRGHFITDIEVQGKRMRAMVDTGATVVALRYEDAERMGLIRSGDRFNRQVSTANGMARAMAVRLNRVDVENVTIYDVEALVMERGRMDMNLLGMSFLRRLSRFEVRPDHIMLER
jgi:aspartyl protease family protein